MPATDLLQLRDPRSFRPSRIATLRSRLTLRRGSDGPQARYPGDLSGAIEHDIGLQIQLVTTRLAHAMAAAQSRSAVTPLRLRSNGPSVTPRSLPWRTRA